MLKILLLTSLLFTEVGDIDYYNIIWENNLFRPLGWTKPDLSPKYELIGTIIGKDFARAYVKSSRSSQIIIVSRNDYLGDSQVVEILSNEIKMEDGEKYSAREVQFLNVGSKKSNRRSRNTSASSGGTGDSTSKNTTGNVQAAENSRGGSRRRRGTSGGADWQAQIQRFQGSSPEERQKMIEEFRSQRGNRSGGRRNRNNQ